MSGLCRTCCISLEDNLMQRVLERARTAYELRSNTFDQLLEDLDAFSIRALIREELEAINSEERINYAETCPFHSPHAMNPLSEERID